ncbi:hypothetical protein [Geoglobus sp.]
MPKQIMIEVPDELEELIRKNPEIKERITAELIAKMTFDEMISGSVSKDLLNMLASSEDVDLEDELKKLKEIRNRARERIKR